MDSNPRLRTTRLSSVAYGALAWAILTHAAAADVVNVTNSNEFQTALDTAVAGTEIVLAPGAYPGRFTATGMTGVAIRSADPANRAVINAAGLGEGFKMTSIHDVTFSDLIIENASVNGINIDDGGHIEASTNINISGLLLRNGSGDGIKLSGVIGFHVDRVQVVGWGGNSTGMNLIGSRDGIVERSYFENLAPSNGTGFQAKSGAANVIVRANRFVNANERAIQIGGSGSLDVFRPQPPGNVNASGIVAEGNVILSNGNTGQGIRSAVSFINVADGVFRNNVAYRPSLFLMRFLKEQTDPGFVDTQGGAIVDNIFLWNNGDLFDAVNVGSGVQTQTFTFARNQWYNMTSPSNSQFTLPNAEVDGVYGVDPQVDLRGVTPWSYAWGEWLVNTSDLADTFTIAPGESYLLATPGEGAALDVGAANPISGSWSLSAVPPGDFAVQPFDYAVLIKIAPSEWAGDYNGDQRVDALDLAIWSGTLGSTEVLAADGDGNGFVDGGDFLLWQSNQGSTAPPLGLPEPGACVLMTLASLALAVGAGRPIKRRPIDACRPLIHSRSNWSRYEMLRHRVGVDARSF